VPPFQDGFQVGGCLRPGTDITHLCVDHLGGAGLKYGIAGTVLFRLVWAKLKGIFHTSCCVITLALAISPFRLLAHDSFYHYLELTPPRDGRAGEVAFSVHAADLAVAIAMGADSSKSDLTWLKDREPAEITAMLDEARKVVIGSFYLEIDGLPLDGMGLHFPDPERLRSGAADAEAARPGFLVALFALDAAAATLEIRLSPTSGKRLLFVVNRPGRFPEIRDLAPGESTTFALTDS